MNAIEQTELHIMSTYGRNAVTLEAGSETTCRDENGKSYIDFGSGIGTNSLGFCNEAWADAVCAQVRTLQHTSNLYYHSPQAQLAEKLCAMTGYSKVFYGNSGAEANECAIKLARKYSFDKYGAGRHTIITLVNSFHGRTLCTLSATGQDVFHNFFFPFVEGFRYVKANDIADLHEKLDDTVCAIMVEYVQGEGGVCLLDADFIKEIRSICTERDILMIADEVQTGIGRTGKLLAGEHFGCMADVTTLAKGLGGGLPIGACLANEKCADVLGKGSHGSTFGGNPVVCAGAVKVLEYMEQDGVMDEIEAKSAYIRERLSAVSEVAAVSGKGLMIGIALKEKKAADVLQQCLEQGLLVLTAKDKVRLLPPLVISMEELAKGMDILCNVLEG
ncbi:MAG: aspartate aminotransferase family protein [Ruminococcus sp.]|nr:aspartate aminotransferase family protein [Ruminococcus sp.]MBQ7002450.1 aspartate aminotransferase family protein [Oscillospiraceae bacterium]